MSLLAVRDELGFPSGGEGYRRLVDHHVCAGRAAGFRDLVWYLRSLQPSVEAGRANFCRLCERGQVAPGSKLLLEYTPPSGPARQYTVGPFVLPPVRVGGRLDVIYDPKRLQEVSLPEHLPKSTRGVVITMAVSGAVLAVCAVRIVIAVRG
ncbi:hypothetical protein [Streptomyces sp. NPDC002054]|uniref:hypothetical protein n=1 Tax=Streptomyces sp. NPDC002054 TaxID=3154663 RepID=UPI003322F8B1